MEALIRNKAAVSEPHSRLRRVRVQVNELLTWASRQVVRGREHSGDHGRPTTPRAPDGMGQAGRGWAEDGVGVDHRGKGYGG